MADANDATLLRKIVDRWMSGRPKLLVWDFDLTILNTHAFSEGVEVDEVADRWQEDIADVELFRAFVSAALAQNATVGIASYGRREVIAEYMRHVFADNCPFNGDNIVTPQALGLPDGTSVPAGKPQMLELLCQRATPAGCDRSAVVFFDDDPDNVRDCLAAGFARAYHTPDGFTAQALEGLEGGVEASVPTRIHSSGLEAPASFKAPPPPPPGSGGLSSSRARGAPSAAAADRKQSSSCIAS